MSTHNICFQYEALLMRIHNICFHGEMRSICVDNCLPDTMLQECVSVTIFTISKGICRLVQTV